MRNRETGKEGMRNNFGASRGRQACGGVENGKRRETMPPSMKRVGIAVFF
jgi:hypothetical protein